MKGTDYQKSNIEGYKIIGSFNNSYTDVGEIQLELYRDNKIFYRSGTGRKGQSISIIGHEKEFIQDLPIAKDWVILNFSNFKLPNRFIVKIKDEGREKGEWSAIAIPN
jgi:hypothetical protein